MPGGVTSPIGPSRRHRVRDKSKMTPAEVRAEEAREKDARLMVVTKYSAADGQGSDAMVKYDRVGGPMHIDTKSDPNKDGYTRKDADSWKDDNKAKFEKAKKGTVFKLVPGKDGSFEMRTKREEKPKASSLSPAWSRPDGDLSRRNSCIEDLDRDEEHLRSQYNEKGFRIRSTEVSLTRSRAGSRRNSASNNLLEGWGNLDDKDEVVGIVQFSRSESPARARRDSKLTSLSRRHSMIQPTVFAFEGLEADALGPVIMGSETLPQSPATSPSVASLISPGELVDKQNALLTPVLIRCDSSVAQNVNVITRAHSAAGSNFLARAHSSASHCEKMNHSTPLLQHATSNASGGATGNQASRAASLAVNTREALSESPVSPVPLPKLMRLGSNNAIDQLVMGIDVPTRSGTSSHPASCRSTGCCLLCVALIIVARCLLL